MAWAHEDLSMTWYDEVNFFFLELKTDYVCAHVLYKSGSLIGH